MAGAPSRPGTSIRPVEEAEAALAESAFRNRFHLEGNDLVYLRRRGGSAVREHAARFIRERLAPAQPFKDGKQTPWRGHPVFVAQHATATCCRACLAKTHWIAAGQPLSADEQRHCVELIMRWLAREYQRTEQRQ
jgi:hypothetical protein